jgi:hypothetical protein
MSREAFDQNNKKFQEELAKIGKPYLLYAPFSTDYWEISPKIVFCNLEAASGGDDASEWSGIMAWETMKDHWMDLSAKYRQYGEKYYPNPTIWRYTIFVYILYKRLNGVSRQCIEKKLEKINDEILVPYLEKMPDNLLNALGKEDIEKVIEKILYMNLQKWWNENEKTKFNDRYLEEFLENPILRECTLDSIRYSDADVFVIAGKDGMQALNNLIPDLALELIKGKNPKTGIKEYDKTLFVVSYHPARGEYFTLKWMLDRIDEIVDKYSSFKEKIEK